MLPADLSDDRCQRLVSRPLAPKRPRLVPRLAPKQSKCLPPALRPGFLLPEGRISPDRTVAYSPSLPPALHPDFLLPEGRIFPDRTVAAARCAWTGPAGFPARRLRYLHRGDGIQGYVHPDASSLSRKVMAADWPRNLRRFGIQGGFHPDASKPWKEAAASWSRPEFTRESNFG